MTQVLALPVDINIKIGSLRRDGKTIVVEPHGLKAGRVTPKAKWSYARLVLGRKFADEQYKEILESLDAKSKQDLIKMRIKPSRYALDKIFENALNSSPREDLQIFVEGSTILSIATNRIHSLISPSEVSNIINSVFKEKGLESIRIPQIQANSPIYLTSSKSVETEVGVWQVGLAIHTGDLLTNKAIKIGSFIRVESCMNPLMWLNGGGWSNPLRDARGRKDLLRDILGRGRISLLNDRVLRWNDKTDIAPRLKQSIEQVRNSVDNFVDFIQENGKQALKLSDAQAVIEALFSSYHLGNAIKEFVFKEFAKLDAKDRTVYELAMITSNMTINPEAPIKDDSKYARSNLSTISAIILSYADIQDLVKKCDERIRAKTIPQ